MKHAHFFNIALGILGVLFFTTLSVVLILNFRPLYYHDMKVQQLSQIYGIEEEEILENYDALIDYNSLFYRGELQLPTLTMSEEGKIHFTEVKRIFDTIQLLLLMSALLFLPLAVLGIRKGEKAFLLLIPGITGVLAGLVLLGALIDWEGFFEAFHHLLFRNDYWLFDPRTDPIISFLPDSFFFHCLIGILLLMVIFLILCLIFYGIIKKKQTSSQRF